MIERIHNCAVQTNFNKSISHNSIDGFLYMIYEQDEDMLKSDKDRINKWKQFTNLLCSKKSV